jgi:hypothetical protein
VRASKQLHFSVFVMEVQLQRAILLEFPVKRRVFWPRTHFALIQAGTHCLFGTCLPNAGRQQVFSLL